MKKKKKKPGRPIRPKRLGNKNIPIIPKLRLCIVALVWSFYINICIDYAKIWFIEEKNKKQKVHR
jgi:hypothetical protein